MVLFMLYGCFYWILGHYGNSSEWRFVAVIKVLSPVDLGSSPGSSSYYYITLIRIMQPV